MNEDFGGDIITISDEDGNEFDLELLDTIEFEGQTYCVFVPADIENMDVNDPDYGLIFLKSREENGVQVATRVAVQLQLTDPEVKSRDRIVKKTEKEGLYTALDVGSVWLERALAK